MQRFNVLDRQQNIHQSYVIEASAGTGKTYSIENIVVRLLIDEQNPCTLEEILVVTFTRAATDDLKMRIRANLTRALEYCRQYIKDENTISAKTPDYLLEIFEEGIDRVQVAKKTLEKALSNFQQAPIFTIHRFCNRMLREYLLEGNISLSNPLDDNGLPPAKVYAVIKDFFRTEINEKLISPGQLQKVISACKGIDKLEKELFGLITKGIDLFPRISLKAQFQIFKDKISSLNANYLIDQDRLLADFILQAPSYKEVCNKQGQPKPENCSMVKRFATLFQKTELSLDDFDILVNDGLYLAEAISPENRSARGKEIDKKLLYYPDFTEQLRLIFGTFVEQISNPSGILATLAIQCKRMLLEHLEQEELMDFDSLLLKMHQALKNQIFVKKVQERFKAAIIDEFQDTDPVQWEIFKTLFSNNCFLYLVGDPKQSIYGFRQADIYTYLEAKREIGDQFSASLEINYRSSEPLVKALNALFHSSALQQLISLPKINGTLPYVSVDSGKLTKAKNFEDGNGAIQFFSLEETKENKTNKAAGTAEESYLFPFIASEILRLCSKGHSNFSDFAILVSDRFQGQNLGEFLKNLQIPIIAQHCSSLIETVAFPAFRELLEGILSPRNESVLKLALGGPILSWTEHDILTMNENHIWEACIAKCLTLRKVWFEKGFPFFFQDLLQSCWDTSEKTVAEKILSRKAGIDFYNDLQQIAELLSEEEARQQTPPNKLIDFFRDIEKLSETEGKAIKRRGDPKKIGVQILTIHSSKGLEFEIVFALGVIKRSKKPSKLIPVSHENGLPMLAAVDNVSDPRYIEQAMEIDSEKIRQLYVAFTRAKQRLYIPLLCGNALGKCELGTASPLELYLARIDWTLPSLNSLYDHIPHPNPETLFKFIDNLSSQESVGHTKLREATFDLTPVDIQKSIALTPPPAVKISGLPEYMNSFTSLIGSSLKNQTGLSAPNNYDFVDQSPHSLPAGKNTGTLLHAILETIPFNIVEQGSRNLALQSHVSKHTQNTAFAKWHLTICDIVYNTLTAKLPYGDDSFSMSEVHADLCYKEHEFVYTSVDLEQQKAEAQPGYMKGIIDLIFQHNGKYFIVDWKSNWLGQSIEDYGPENLSRSMHEHHYYLQAEIYKRALKRYLRLCDARPFEKIFGGVYYLFLRGLSPNSGEGVVVT